MDPDEVLKQLRTVHDTLEPKFDSDVDLLVSILDDTIHPDALGELLGHIGAMLDLFGALDNWLTKGGFAPQAWSRTETPNHTPQTDVEKFSAGVLRALGGESSTSTEENK